MRSSHPHIRSRPVAKLVEIEVRDGNGLAQRYWHVV